MKYLSIWKYTFDSFDKLKKDKDDNACELTAIPRRGFVAWEKNFESIPFSKIDGFILGTTILCWQP